MAIDRRQNPKNIFHLRYVNFVILQMENWTAFSVDLCEWIEKIEWLYQVSREN